MGSFSKNISMPEVRFFQFYLFLLIMIAGMACQEDDGSNLNIGNIQLQSVRIGSKTLSLNTTNSNIDRDKPIVAVFSSQLDTSSVHQAVKLIDENGEEQFLNFNWLDGYTSFSAKTEGELRGGGRYKFEISEDLLGELGETFPGISYDIETILPPLQVISATVDGVDLLTDGRKTEISLNPEIVIGFSNRIDPASVSNSTIRVSGQNAQNESLYIVLGDDSQSITVSFQENLIDISRYQLTLSDQIKGREGESLSLFTKTFYTTFSDEPKFEIISDEELLTLVQQQTFKYFWDFAHPVSGLARERNSSGDLVTIGGSGFGLMAWIVGAERGFITRSEAVTQFTKALNYLEQADRFHGVWPHWLNGNTGATIPFSTQDDGADLVETSFMIQALLTWKQYLNPAIAEELSLRNRIDQLYAEVEWDWFTRDGQNVLYWHWSPNFAWQMNLPIRGWNECLITYFLASASPTYPIDAQVYHEGWARNGGMVNGNSYYEIPLPLGETRGGPLFYSHYSFLGLDPRGLSDTYANYFEQNRNHTLINRAHAIANPLDYVAYSSTLWGFTAGDNPSGYSAHSPTNDVGTIQPTAAISSIPYTPDESMEAIKTFYYKLGDRLWGEYGFYDGIDITRGWVANSFLAIDQGPIIIMIENHRSSLLWDLFMANPEVHTAMDKLDFVKTN